jgi:hypothetical protein
MITLLFPDSQRLSQFAWIFHAFRISGPFNHIYLSFLDQSIFIFVADRSDRAV